MKVSFDRISHVEIWSELEMVGIARENMPAVCTTIEALGIWLIDWEEFKPTFRGYAVDAA